MRIGTWNINGGIFDEKYSGEFFDKTKKSDIDEECLIDISKTIIENRLEIVALQEVITTESLHYLERLSKLCDMPYFSFFEISPCHLVKNTMFGVAFISKYPIKEINKQIFKNPNLVKQTEKGLYSTHDKGYLWVNVQTPKKEISLITTQLLPFHRFDAKIEDFKELFADFENNISKTKSIALGDFNALNGVEQLVKVFPELEKDFNFVFNQVTTSDNKKCDNIIISKNIKINESLCLDSCNISDHFLCLVDIDI